MNKRPLKVRNLYECTLTSQSSVRVMALIHSLCVMLQTTPFHRENYSRLVVGVIVQYYQQCSARFKGALTTTATSSYLELASLPSNNINAAEPPLALPAVWAQHGEMITCLTELRAVAVCTSLRPPLTVLLVCRSERARPYWAEGGQIGDGSPRRKAGVGITAHPFTSEARSARSSVPKLGG